MPEGPAPAPAGRHLGFDALHEIRLQLGPTARKRGQAGGVAAGEIGMVDEFAGHHRHPAHGRHSFGLDESQGLARIPAVHQDKLPPAAVSR